MTFAIGLEACRCLEDVLMPSSGLCHYQIKYLKPPWWRLQHVMFIRPQEDHPKTSPHDVCNWTGRMHMSWRRLDAFFGGYATIKWNILKPPWWRLQHVMFIRPQEDHPKASPHDVCKWTWSMHASWRCPDAFFTVMIKLSNNICKALLDTSSNRHIYARWPNW